MSNDDHRTGESVFTYDVGPTESLSDGVVMAVATISSTDPVSDTLPGTETDDPLYTVVVPEALDSVFQGADDDTARTSGRVIFPYHGYEVTVHSMAGSPPKNVKRLVWPTDLPDDGRRHDERDAAAPIVL